MALQQQASLPWRHPTRANRLFWRAFLTSAGAAFGVIVALFAVAVLGWVDALPLVTLCGAAVGAASGWAVSPAIPRVVARLRTDEPPVPPPLGVTRPS